MTTATTLNIITTRKVFEYIENIMSSSKHIIKWVSWNFVEAELNWVWDGTSASIGWSRPWLTISDGCTAGQLSSQRKIEVSTHRIDPWQLLGELHHHSNGEGHAQSGVAYQLEHSHVCLCLAGRLLRAHLFYVFLHMGWGTQPPQSWKKRGWGLGCGYSFVHTPPITYSGQENDTYFEKLSWGIGIDQ